MILSAKNALRRFRRSEDGSNTIEFCILFPAFLAIMLSSVEAGVMMVRNVMLKRGADLAVRQLRLGTPVPPSYEDFKQAICDNAIIFQDCNELIQVELMEVSTDTWNPLVGNEVDGRANCINESEHLRDDNAINPVSSTTYDDGENNSLMMVRVCGLFTPFFPTTKFGMQMPKYNPPETADDPFSTGEDFVSEKYALVVTTAFVNEPSR